MAPPYTVFSAEQISLSLASLLTDSGMFVNAGSWILPLIMLPHTCLWMPEFLRILVQVSIVSTMDSEEFPVKIGSCDFTWSVSMFVWCVTIPLVVNRFLRLSTYFCESVFFLISWLNAIKLLRKSSPKHSSSSMVIAANALQVVCRSLCNLSAFFPACLCAANRWLSSEALLCTNLYFTLCLHHLCQFPS